MNTKQRFLAFAAAAMLAACSPAQQSRVSSKGDVSPEPMMAAPPVAVNVPLDDSLHASALRELETDADAASPVLRSNAIEALQNQSPRDAVDPATRGLGDPDPTVRFAACMAVGNLHLTQTHDRLLQMRDTDPSAVVQVGIRFALHRIGDQRFSHDLEKFAKSDDPQVRGKTAFVLGRLGEPSAVDVLRPLRHDEESTIRLEAASSMWMLGNEQGLDDLIAWAVSKYPDDLMLATLDLAQPKDQRVIQHVRNNLVADYPEVNLVAARALGILGSDEGYAVATKFVRSKDPRQRYLAALALGAIGRSDAQTSLRTLMKDPSESVRLSAASAVLQIDAKNTIVPLASDH